MDIKIDDLTGSEVTELLREHLQSMALHSPPESIHALDIEELKKPEITFWSVMDSFDRLAEILSAQSLNIANPILAEHNGTYR